AALAVPLPASAEAAPAGESAPSVEESASAPALSGTAEAGTGEQAIPKGEAIAFSSTGEHEGALEKATADSAPAPATGEWAEWVFRLEESALPREALPLAEEARRAPATYAFTLRLSWREETGEGARYLARLQEEGRPPVAGELVFDLLEFWRELGNVSGAAKEVDRREETLQAAGKILSVTRAVIELGPPAGAGQAPCRFIRWTSEALSLGPVRLEGPGLTVELAAFGRGAPPAAFPCAAGGKQKSSDVP
ncbi:MAG: hypothetical protein V1918_06005, partial [Planctomycetota bacterium]